MLTIMSIILLLAGILNLVTNVTLMTSGNLMKMAMEQVKLSGGILTVYLIVCIIFGMLEIVCGATSLGGFVFPLLYLYSIRFCK